MLDIANEMMVDFYSNEVEMKPGAFEFLEHLKSNGTRMVIASATSPDLINLALKHCEIEHYFERLFSCADIGKGKDEPDVFLAALEYLGNDLSETWVFEDSAVAIETAVKAGFNTVAIYDKNNFGQDLMKKIATHYIAEGQGLDSLI